jgi:hypothetical protein
MTPDFWYVYESSPIDFWRWTLTAEEHLRRLAEQGDDEDADETLETLAAELRAGVLAIASRTSGEGDGVLRVGAIPDPDSSSMRPIVIAGQKSKSATFLASRHRLPWLELYCGRTTASPRPLPCGIARRLEELDELEARLLRERLPVC